MAAVYRLLMAKYLILPVPPTVGFTNTIWMIARSPLNWRQGASKVFDAPQKQTSIIYCEAVCLTLENNIIVLSKLNMISVDVQHDQRFSNNFIQSFIKSFQTFRRRSARTLQIPEVIHLFNYVLLETRLLLTQYLIPSHERVQVGYNMEKSASQFVEPSLPLLKSGSFHLMKQKLHDYSAVMLHAVETKLPVVESAVLRERICLIITDNSLHWLLGRQGYTTL